MCLSLFNDLKIGDCHRKGGRFFKRIRGNAIVEYEKSGVNIRVRMHSNFSNVVKEGSIAPSHPQYKSVLRTVNALARETV